MHRAKCFSSSLLKDHIIWTFLLTDLLRIILLYLFEQFSTLLISNCPIVRSHNSHQALQNDIDLFFLCIQILGDNASIVLKAIIANVIPRQEAKFLTP